MVPIQSWLAAAGVLLLASTASAANVPQRFEKLAPEKFSELVKDGIPFIVTDLGKDWQLKEWSCAYLKERWGEQKLIPTFDKGSGPVEMASDWEKNSIAFDSPPAAGEAKYASFMWSPMAESEEDGGTISATRLQKVKSAYSVPYFMENNEVSQRFVTDRFEIFLGMPESGARMHTDEICVGSFSFQISGRKHWRLSDDKRTGDSYMPFWEHYGTVRDTPAAAQFDYEFELSAGEAIFYPPNWSHATVVLGSDCSTSATMQFLAPFPVHFVRNNLAKLTHSDETHLCFLDSWAPFITGDRMDVDLPRLESGSARAKAKERFTVLDSNLDHIISKAEVTAALNDSLPGKPSTYKSQLATMYAQLFQDFHQADSAGVSKASFMKSFTQLFFEMNDARGSIPAEVVQRQQGTVSLLESRMLGDTGDGPVALSQVPDFVKQALVGDSDDPEAELRALFGDDDNEVLLIGDPSEFEPPAPGEDDVDIARQMGLGGDDEEGDELLARLENADAVDSDDDDDDDNDDDDDDDDFGVRLLGVRKPQGKKNRGGAKRGDKRKLPSHKKAPARKRPPKRSGKNTGPRKNVSGKHTRKASSGKHTRKQAGGKRAGKHGQAHAGALQAGKVSGDDKPSQGNAVQSSEASSKPAVRRNMRQPGEKPQLQRVAKRQPGSSTEAPKQDLRM